MMFVTISQLVIDYVISALRHFRKDIGINRMNIDSIVIPICSVRMHNIISGTLYLTCISLLFNLIPLTTAQHPRRRQSHRIDWSSSNPLFQARPAVLNVRLGDTIDFHCPQYNHSADPSTVEYNTLYLVSEIDYNLCFTRNYLPILRCDQPFAAKRSLYTLSISKYLPYPNMPEFLDGRSYYFVSTSTGEQTGINQKFDGLCREKNFRLVVDVQKYYRRYSIQDPQQLRSKIQRQLASRNDMAASSSERVIASWSFVLFPIVIGCAMALAFY